MGMVFPKQTKKVSSAAGVIFCGTFTKQFVLVHRLGEQQHQS
jgi:hypothetical protein